MADQEAIFAAISQARYSALKLEDTLETQEQRDAMATLRKQLKELHYQTIPWST